MQSEGTPRNLVKYLQVLVLAREWRFKSSHPHQVDSQRPKVVEIIEAIGAQVQISRLTVVELRSVFAIKVRTQVVSREDVSLLLRQFQEDIVARKFHVFAVRESEFALAERLIESAPSINLCARSTRFS